MAKLLVDCQDPRKVDKVLKIHSQIDQTKAVMYVVVVLFECAFELLNQRTLTGTKRLIRFWIVDASSMIL